MTRSPRQPKPSRRADTQDTAADRADDDENGPLRRCIVTRERASREDMIRFVVGPGRVLVPDLAARLPGRGIWLSARGDVVETARAKGAFARAARGQVTVPPDLGSLLQAGLARRIGELLGLARRAGQAVCGYQKAREWLAGGRAGLLVQARDGSVAERARCAGVASGVAVVAPLSAAALGAVFGRDHVVHVAIRPGRLADALTIEAKRLSGLAGVQEEQMGGIDGATGEAQSPVVEVAVEQGLATDLPGGMS